MPFTNGSFGVTRAEIEQEWSYHVEIMSEMLKHLPNLAQEEMRGLEGMRRVVEDRLRPTHQAEGAALRQIRALLDEVDPTHQWGGLRKVLTPEGHYLWLCEYHAQQYRS